MGIFLKGFNNRYFIFFLHAAPRQVCTNIKIQTLSYGSENNWTYGNCNSHYTLEYTKNSMFTEKCCQPSMTYELVCSDRAGDGWHGGYIEIGGVKYCEDFKTGSSQSHQVVMPGKVKFKDTISSSNYVKPLRFFLPFLP